MIKWGVIGLGGIASRFCESLSQFEDACFYAGGSYTAKKREQFQERFHPEKLYSDYDALLADPKIDAVYIAVPHGMHYRWASAALQAGKHVLCEKPACLTKDEIEQLCTYAKEHNLIFIEAMKSRFIPLMKDLHDLIDRGDIGEITHVEGHFTFKIDYREGHYMFDANQGGTLYDAGCYGLAYVNDFIKAEVESMTNDVTMAYGVDVHDHVHMTFTNGATAYVEAGIDDPTNQRFGIIQGTKGRIDTNPFYRPTQALVTLEDGTTYELKRDYDVDDFHTEIEAMHICIRNQLLEAAAMPHADSITYIGWMEEIKKL